MIAYVTEAQVHPIIESALYVRTVELEHDSAIFFQCILQNTTQCTHVYAV